MAASLLAALTAAGVLERAGRPRRTVLRVAPRFLAHAEATAERLRSLADARDAVTLALMTWDGYHSDVHEGSRVLRSFLEDHHQTGSLRPVFPALENFAVAA